MDRTAFIRHAALELLLHHNQGTVTAIQKAERFVEELEKRGHGWATPEPARPETIQIPCGSCEGRGIIPAAGRHYRCPNCNGSGKETVNAPPRRP